MTKTFNGRWDSIPDSYTLPGLVVRIKKPADKVVGRFLIDDWHRIFFDIDTDRQLNQFLKQESALVRSYILKCPETDETFGWICLRRFDKCMCDSVEFHGGAWLSSPGYARKKFLAACVVIESLLRLGIRVNSKALNSNVSALRFLEAIGFRVVNRFSTKPYRYLSLNRRRFESSLIYRRISMKSSNDSSVDS